MNIEDVMKFLQDKDFVQKLTTEDAKKQLLVFINDQFLPVAKNAGDEYIQQLKEQGNNESGWVKFRDCYFIPIVIKIGYYLFSTATKQILQHT